jgi:hypothetical protein
MALNRAKTTAPVESAEDKAARLLAEQQADMEASNTVADDHGDGVEDTEAPADQNVPVTDDEPVTEQGTPVDELKSTVAAEPEPEFEQEKQVATTSAEGTKVTVTEARTSASAQFKSEMEEAGFEGMNVTGMSFDRVKLHEGKFVMGSGEGISLGESFDMQLLSTRDQFIVRQFDGDDAKVFFSYDPQGRTLTDGKSSEEILNDWKEDGYGTPEQPLDIKKYLEGMAVLINRQDEHEGTVVSLSIPPASAPRLAGAAVIARQKFKALPSEVVIRAKVGSLIKKGNTSFRPWVFVAVGRLDAE